MSDVTRILGAIQGGDREATQELIPLVYEELRRLAQRMLSVEKPGQTLQATALVHEAYLRLVGPEEETGWDSRGHFFAAAAEAMRRILIEQGARLILGIGQIPPPGMTECGVDPTDDPLSCEEFHSCP